MEIGDQMWVPAGDTGEDWMLVMLTSRHDDEGHWNVHAFDSYGSDVVVHESFMKTMEELTTD